MARPILVEEFTELVRRLNIPKTAPIGKGSSFCALVLSKGGARLEGFYHLYVFTLAVAVSGGPDSLSLVLLASKVFKNVTGLIVNHKLRAESHWEAREVQSRLAAKGNNFFCCPCFTSCL